MSEITNDLFSNIKKEKEQRDSHDRYPIRFLFLPLSKNLAPYIISLINEFNLNAIKLSNYFSQNKWETWEHLYSKIEFELENSNSDLLFIGLSEYLRFQDKESVASIFLNLIGLENTYDNRAKKRRAYFLMDSFENLFTSYVQESHHRNIFYNPIIFGESKKVSPESKRPELIISKSCSSDNEKNNVKNVHDYLDIATNSDDIDFTKFLYCSSSTIINLANKYNELLDDSLFPYISISNPEMLLERKIKGLELKSKNLPSNFINWLAIGINMDSDTMNFEDFIKNKLTLSSSDIEVLFYYYFSTKNDNEKKLLKLAFEFIGTRNSMAHYVDYLLTNYTINTKQEFIKSLYLCTDLHVMESGYIARKEWIKIIKNKDGNIEAPNELFQIFSDELLKDIKKHIYFDQTTISIQNDNIDDLLMLKTDSREKVEQIYSTYKERFVNKILTSESQNEKRLIVLLASNNIFNNNELETFYPDLYGYLFYKSNSFTNIPSLDEYFGEYKKSKIANRATNKYKTFVDKYSSEQFLSFYNKDEFKNIDNSVKAQHIFVLDGVGAEYLRFITYLLEKKHGIVLSISEYRKALLPTTTEANKRLIDRLKPIPVWLREFDAKIIHDEFYSVEKNIEKALTILGKMIDKVVEMSNKESFLIIADHGCTASHKIINTSKKYSCFPNAEHNGRCCEIDDSNTIDQSDDYITYTDTSGKDWVISIKPVSLNNTAKYEAHGGGTIEEIFVPYIYYGIIKEQNKYKISVIKKQVSGLDKSIKFSINTMINSEEIKVIEETGNVVKPIFSEGLYICTLSIGRKQKVTIKIGEQEEIITVESTSGINSRKGDFF